MINAIQPFARRVQSGIAKADTIDMLMKPKRTKGL